MTIAAYRDWQRTVVNISGKPYVVATKPGAFGHGAIDASAELLADHVEVPVGSVVVYMNCGGGLLGAVAAPGAERVLLTDRNIVSVEAARRTLAANNVANGEVFLGHGASELPADTSADVVAIRIPHEKLALLQLLTDAFRILKIGGRCYLAGATNEGAKSAARTLEAIFGNGNVLAHGSGHRLVAATKRAGTPASTEDLENPLLRSNVFHEFPAILRGYPFELSSRPGVFSWDHVDEATEILAAAMQVEPGNSVLDLGCGCGALGVVAARLSRTGRVTMVDADVEAVRSAARTAAAAGIENVSVLPSDVASAVMNERFDVVVTNPPFHVGKATDLDVPLQFIQDAWQVLATNGKLFLVANRTLPYERAIFQRFGNVDMVHDGRRFKVLTAVKAAR